MSAQRDPSLPRLPPELIQAVIEHLRPGVLVGDLATERALAVLACVSRLVRAWSLDVRWRTLMVPRHVRDFRRMYARLRSGVPPFPCAGYTKSMFVALDDVSRLTSSSAGWESELLRLLHYSGPSLEVLSLWHSESRAVLRDTAQTRGKRKAGVLQPAWSWGEGEELSQDQVDEESDQEGIISAAPGGLPLDSPSWLRHELDTLSHAEFTKRHHAHVALRPQRRDKDKRAIKGGCRPRTLSIIFALPLFEHEDPDLFARMTIWTRCEELDVFVPVVSHIPTALQLFSTLVRSPLRRLRISSVHATLLLALPPFSDSSPRANSLFFDTLDDNTATAAPTSDLNLAAGLRQLMRSSTIHGTILNEFGGYHFEDVKALERALTAGLTSSTRDEGISGLASSLGRTGVEDAPSSEAKGLHHRREDAVRVRIIQGKQAVWGKLKERQMDFLERSAGRDGAWKTLGA